MQPAAFWKSWAKPYQYIFFALSVLSITTLLVFWWVYFQDSARVFTWTALQQLESVESVSKTFSVGLYEVEMPAFSLVLFESLLGSDLQFASLYHYLFFLCLFIGVFTFVAIITTLKRFSFFIGMSLVIVWVMSLNLESILLFGLSNQIPTIAVIVLLGSVAFYFQAFNTAATFAFRWLVFLAIGLTLSIIFIVAASVPQPLLQLSVNSLITGTLLSLLFVIMAAHEIVALFVDIVTRTKSPSKSAMHFYVISGIYLVNLFLSYLIKEGHLNLDFWIVNSFFLLTISALLAIWGFNRREPLYVDLLHSPALAVFACLSLFTICFSFLALLFASASNTLTEGMQDLILYAHLGYGLIFVVYVTANFSPMLLANLPVYKILYKPDTMLFFTYRLGGIIATFAFLSFASTWGAYVDQTYAAYYNGQGDLLWARGEVTAAEGYYKKSLVYRNQNHHAHYALGTLYTQQLDPAKARYEFSIACENSPSEMSFTQLADLYSVNGNPLAQALVLQEGLKKLPTSARLQNALGLAYTRLGNRDSAIFFFNQSRQATDVRETAETNLLASAAKFRFDFPADSLLTLLKSDKASAQSNALALGNVQGLQLTIPFQLPADTVLSVKQAVLLVNYLVNQRNNVDTALLKKIETLSRKSSNDTFKDELQAAVAQCYYDWGMTKKAGELMREVAYRSADGKYFHLLGVWLLDQENPATAARYFKLATEKGITNADWLQALSWLEADSVQKAMPLLAELALKPDTTTAKRATKILKSLQSNVSDIMTHDDLEKVLFVRYGLPLNYSVGFGKIVSELNANLKARAVLYQSKRYFNRDEIFEATVTLQQCKGLAIKDKKLFDALQFFNLQILAAQENWQLLKEQLPKVNLESYPAYKIYFEALLAEAEGNATEAKSKFEFLSVATIQSEDIALAAARYFLKDTTDRLKPYGIIVNGLLAKPNSIKLLKVYVKEAAVLGFDEESEEALDKLRKLMTPKAFNAYIRENPDFFDVQ